MGWEAIAAIVAALALLGGVFMFLWRLNNSFRDRTETLQNDIAWVNKDVAEVKKDVEWLVWFFKEGRERK